MRRINMMTGLDMEQQHSDPDIPPHMNPIPTFQPYDNNNSMFNGLPQYPPPHHHQGASNLGPGISTPPNLYSYPYAPTLAPPSHRLAHGAAVGVTSTVHETNPHFMGQGYKRKSAQVIPGNYQHLIEAAPPCSFPHYGNTTYPQPIDQRSVRSRVGADPPYPHAHNSFIQGNYGPHPGSIWYDQHCNDNGSSSLWPQPPSLPYIHGNAVAGSIDSGNVFFPRHHEASSSRDDIPFSYPSPYYFSHHPPPRPPPTVYPNMASASSYTVPMRPVQSTGFRINQQHPRDYFSPAATLRHHGLPHLSAIPTYVEELGFEEGDFYDDVNYVDDHQDMRLDIEDMSYEELLALSDHIGTVKTGLSEETVKDLVKRRTSISTRINLEEAPPSTDLETDSCTICQENYKNQDKMVTLDCKHEYHAECLEKWLVIKNICPICKSEALVMEKNKEQ